MMILMSLANSELVVTVFGRDESEKGLRSIATEAAGSFLCCFLPAAFNSTLRAFGNSARRNLLASLRSASRASAARQIWVIGRCGTRGTGVHWL